MLQRAPNAGAVWARRHRLTGGFSLVELLVVVGIIAVLAHMVFPVYARAREKARAASCVSSLHQVQTALEMYVQDYDEALPATYKECPPRPFPPTDGFPVPATWMTAFFPYMQNQQVLACPSAANSFIGLYDGLRVDYGVNESLTAEVSPLAKVQDVAEVALLADCTIHRFFGGDAGRRRVAYANGPDPVYEPPRTITGDGYERHSGGSNIAYCDGHVKWQPADFIMEQLRMR